MIQNLWSMVFKKKPFEGNILYALFKYALSLRSTMQSNFFKKDKVAVNKNIPYVFIKPFHASQKEIKKWKTELFLKSKYNIILD